MSEKNQNIPRRPYQVVHVIKHVWRDDTVFVKLDFGSDRNKGSRGRLFRRYRFNLRFPDFIVHICEAVQSRAQPPVINSLQENTVRKSVQRLWTSGDHGPVLHLGHELALRLHRVVFSLIPVYDISIHTFLTTVVFICFAQPEIRCTSMHKYLIGLFFSRPISD